MGRESPAGERGWAPRRRLGPRAALVPAGVHIGRLVPLVVWVVVLVPVHSDDLGLYDHRTLDSKPAESGFWTNGLPVFWGFQLVAWYSAKAFFADKLVATIWAILV